MEPLVEKVQDVVKKTLQEYKNFLGPAENISKDHLNQLFSPKDYGLVEAGARLLSVSLLLGMDHVNSDLSLAEDDFAKPLPFDEAIGFLKGRVPLTKKEWLELEPKLRFRAFTVAKLAQHDAINKVRRKLISAIEKGEGLSSFWDKLENKGSGDPYYWETVYRTNIQTAYNTGRRMQIDKDKPQALELIVIEDSRTTKTCLPLQGLVLPADHPFWKSNWPPFHFNCRTTVRPIYKESDEWARITNPSMSSLRKSFKPQEGFGTNPLESGNFYKPSKNMWERIQKYGLKEAIMKVSKKLGINSLKPEKTS